MMRKRILTSIFLISLISFFAVNLTNSFFSDTESSNGNTLAAGKVDLKIDNTSYYNGVLNETTTWGPQDLVDHKFFDFSDLKPSDWGEDTISITVDDNDAWLCADIDVTQDDDNDCNEPELIDDPSCTPDDDDLFDGEVGSLVNMVFWVDDGDNVFETDEEEQIINEGTVIDILTDTSWALAQSDQEGRILLDANLNEDGSAKGGDTYYIAKYWCFGELTKEPVIPGENSPTDNSGFTCNGDDINNAPQTDSLLADISFYATQARNNEGFNCSDRNLLWIIGNEELSQEDNPMDELNWTGTFGVFPTPPAIGATYTRTITQPVDDTADLEFPWNTNYGANYGRNIIVEFSYSGPTIPVVLTVGWSPGRSANEAKDIYLDGIYEWTTGPYLGATTAGWWEQMPRYEDSYSFNLTDGDHTLEFRHLYGDGTLWDFIKLEKQ